MPVGHPRHERFFNAIIGKPMLAREEHRFITIALVSTHQRTTLLVFSILSGKSTLLNHILWKTEDDQEKDKQGKIRAGNRNKRKGAVTTSPLPGTTLKFIKVDLGGRNLYDTPGLLVPGTLTQLLTPDELKIVVPKK